MVGLMKFKTQKKMKNIKKMLEIKILQIFADGKFIFFGHFDCIYAHKNDKLQKTQVSTTS